MKFDNIFQLFMEPDGDTGGQNITAWQQVSYLWWQDQ